ncbi:Ankyrin repeat-containing protein [Rhynchospora pubera]|uniref:Ankyrin repeat-containing protein n=1 Tax=Rhynchospora pubera TaxID=906938 RepID=A0AAV8AKR9_9POAL|nr:Ankyrin repeat-containing protein [Rhynchospora pubera]KAJ4772741.1 Ankyrin repeat-containing protein [Rhynchospora pubera]
MATRANSLKKFKRYARTNQASNQKVSQTDQLMDRQFLEACSSGDVDRCKLLVREKANVLFSVTPHGNNCLHIAAMLGYEEFAKAAWSASPSLFSGTNKDGETPLIAAFMAANATLASDMLTAASELLGPDIEGGKPLNKMLLKVDERGDNALHHALRNGFEDLAIRLLNIEPGLSEQINKIAESPMHMAARKGYFKVVERLLEIPDSPDSGPGKYSALHAAVSAGHTDIIKILLNGRPKLAYHIDEVGYTPLTCAVCSNSLEIVKILLGHDPNMAYVKSGDTGETPFLTAALYGSVPVAKEILRTCPDSAYIANNDWENALHTAISNEKPQFVDFILSTPRLHRLINQQNALGNLPLHYAATKCNSEILRSLLNHKRQDCTASNAENTNAVDAVMAEEDLMKTLKWNESFTLVSSVIPSLWRNAATDEAKYCIKEKSIEEVKSLAERYISNTSLVAALLATITFAAAFTLPGGFSSDPSDAGIPIFAREAVFQAFLISDTIAMCSSLAVTFLCILATWEDLDYLLHYRKITKALMWSAYATTTVAFGTGLFTVMAPKSLWLAVLVLVLSCLLPFLSKIIGDWPKIMVRLRVGRHFRSDLVPNI